MVNKTSDISPPCWSICIQYLYYTDILSVYCTLCTVYSIYRIRGIFNFPVTTTSSFQRGQEDSKRNNAHFVPVQLIPYIVEYIYYSITEKAVHGHTPTNS